LSFLATSYKKPSYHNLDTSTIEPMWVSLTVEQLGLGSRTIYPSLLSPSTIEILPIKTITSLPTIPISKMSPKPAMTSVKTVDEPTFEPILTYAPSQTIGPVQLDSWCIPVNAESTKAKVTAVIDGITIEATINGKTQTIRYIGIDLPNFSEDASIWNSSYLKNRELVEGKTILLVKDQSEEDTEGLLKRYALAGSIFVNRELVESGYAIAVSTPPDTSCNGILKEAEESARATHRGLWAFTPTPSRTFPTATLTPSHQGDLIIVRISPKGTIWQEPEEYVEIYNDGTTPVQLRDWTLRDIENHVFVFPGFVLGPQQYCRVYTNQYRPENCGFSYYSLSPIWENDGDCAYLKDSDGVLIDTFCYD